MKTLKRSIHNSDIEDLIEKHGPLQYSSLPAEIIEELEFLIDRIDSMEEIFIEHLNTLVSKLQEIESFTHELDSRLRNMRNH